MHLYYCHLWLLLKNAPSYPGLLDSYIYNSELHTVHLAPPSSPDKKISKFILSSILSARDCFFIFRFPGQLYTQFKAVCTLSCCSSLLGQKSGPIHSCEVCLPFLYQSLLKCYLHNSKLHMLCLVLPSSWDKNRQIYRFSFLLELDYQKLFL